MSTIFTFHFPFNLNFKFQEYQDLTAKLHELKLLEQNLIEKVQQSEKEKEAEEVSYPFHPIKEILKTF